MNKRISRWLWWVPVLLWLWVIYLFSAQTGAQSGDLSRGLTRQILAWLWPNWEQLAAEVQGEKLAAFGLFIRKCAHFTEFAVLGGLLLNALTRWQECTGWRQAAWAALGGLLVAMGDELHQAFVPNRGPAVTDVLIDFSGVVCGVLLLWWIYKRTNRSRS